MQLNVFFKQNGLKCMDVLVYDNQRAYYQLLVTHLSGEYNFVLYSSLIDVAANFRWNAMIFFLYDEMELPDFVKLYNKDVPVVFGIDREAKKDTIVIEGNIYYLHLNKLKEDIIEEASLVLDKVMAVK